MVQLCTVKQIEVEPWQSYVESSRVKQTHGRIMQSLVDEVEPWQIYVESNRVKQNHGTVMQSLVE